MHPGPSNDSDDPRTHGILPNIREDDSYSIEDIRLLTMLGIIVFIVATFLVLGYQEMTQTNPGQNDFEVFGKAMHGLWLDALGIMGWGEKVEPLKKKETAREFYCKQKLDTKRIFGQISRQVLNQKDALATLEKVMKSLQNQNVTSVALIGSPGVGKSLTAIALRQQFPWQENVHTYSWSTEVSDGVKKFQMLRLFMNQLSDCGQNLIIIDNLVTCNYGVVSIYNELLNDRKVNQTVFVVYIFNLEMEYRRKQLESLLGVDTTIINYRNFGRDELSDCLQQELRLEQRTLGQAKISQILDQALLNVQDIGCKKLRQQVLQYGQLGVN